jgi:hypothetical protein
MKSSLLLLGIGAAVALSGCATDEKTAANEKKTRAAYETETPTGSNLIQRKTKKGSAETDPHEEARAHKLVDDWGREADRVSMEAASAGKPK